LILGGAGFVGSNIVQVFLNNDYEVTVIDGLLQKTGGSKENLKQFLSDITFVHSKIEDFEALEECIEQHHVIIDCMAWTSHKEALEDPEYDLQLNVSSHLHLIKNILKKKNKKKKIIYLASRGQYGNANSSIIDEATPMIPIDIQGNHKLAAESHYRIYSNLNDLNIISLRFPNCFGLNQPFAFGDIGLIGSFIRDLLQDKTIEIFGKQRKRSLVYASDIAEIVFRLINQSWEGFHPLNVAGSYLSIEEIVINLKDIIKKGEYIFKPMPDNLKKIDMGNIPIKEDQLIKLINEVPKTNLKSALLVTVDYFKKVLYERYDLAL